MLLDDLLSQMVAHLAALPVDQRIEAINSVRSAVHQVSPMRDHPVDLILWVPAHEVEANDYNPNTVAAPEMRLLELSIEADGYTQPVVTWEEDGRRETVDGFHRGEVGRKCESVRMRTMGLLPVTTIRSDRIDKSDRVASTIRHNRARGRHQVNAMSDIVRDLAKRNWSDVKIGRELGMEPDEVLRLKQIAGLAELFADRDFSEAWEPDIQEGV
jgi:ParB-like chromosome segregation protein Spo0J